MRHFSTLRFVTPAAALLLLPLGVAGAQNNSVDPRWQPWIGCWEASNSAGLRVVGSATEPMVCAVPSGTSNGLDVVTFAGGKVLDRTSLDASGQRLARERDGCTGWESGAWAASGSRVYVRSEYSCAGGATRTSNGVLSISPTGEWLDVQNIATGAAGGVRVMRMREAANLSAVPAEIAAALLGRPGMMGVPRNAAAATLSINDLVDVAQHVDSTVMQAWVIERDQGFVLDAPRLTHLADSGVPANVIDAMVALSYPKLFAVNSASRSAEMRPGETLPAGSRERSLSVVGYDATGFPVFGYGSFGGYYGSCDMPYYGSSYYYSPRSSYYSGCPYGYSMYGSGRYGYGNGYGYGTGYGYGYGWYPPGYGPVIIVRGTGGDVPDGERARVVKGRGYSSGSSGGSSGSSGSSSSGSSGSSGGSSSSGSSGSSGSGGAAAAPRTAQPRKPPAA